MGWSNQLNFNQLEISLDLSSALVKNTLNGCLNRFSELIFLPLLGGVGDENHRYEVGCGQFVINCSKNWLR